MYTNKSVAYSQVMQKALKLSIDKPFQFFDECPFSNSEYCKQLVCQTISKA